MVAQHPAQLFKRATGAASATHIDRHWCLASVSEIKQPDVVGRHFNRLVAFPDEAAYLQDAVHR